MSKMHAFIAILIGSICMNIETAQNNDTCVDCIHETERNTKTTVDRMLSAIESRICWQNPKPIIPSKIVRQWIEENEKPSSFYLSIHKNRSDRHSYLTDSDYKKIDDMFQENLRKANGNMTDAFRLFKNYFEDTVTCLISKPFLLFILELHDNEHASECAFEARIKQAQYKQNPTECSIL